MAMVCFAGLCHGWADPIITQPPQNQAVFLGSEAGFSVEAMGEEPTPEKLEAHRNDLNIKVNGLTAGLAQLQAALAQVNSGLAQVEAELAQVNVAIAQFLEKVHPLPALMAQRATLLGQKQGLLAQQTELNDSKRLLNAEHAKLTAQLEAIRSFNPARFNAENNFLLYQWVRIYMRDFPEYFLNNVVGDQHNLGNLIPFFPRGMPGGGTTISINFGTYTVPVPIHNVDGAITNTLRIPATRASDFGSYAVIVADVFGNPLVSRC